MVAGSLLFYHSDELHYNQNTLLTSRNINIEITDTILKDLKLSVVTIEKAIQNTALTKFLILKIILVFFSKIFSISNM